MLLSGSIGRRIITAVVLNTAFALVFPLLMWSVGVDSDLASLRHDFAIALLYAQVIGLLGLPLYPVFVRRVRKLSPLWQWLAITLFFMTIGITGSFLAESIELAAGRFPMARFWLRFWEVIKVCAVLTVEFGIIGSIVTGLRLRLEESNRELREKEMAQQRALQLATEARLAALEAKVQPHFLFNALNSISSLIREDPRRAERLLGRMAALLRFLLDSHSGGLVSLEKETKIVIDYLEIEQARLGERLKYTVDIPQDLLGVPVPPLSVQTLVENSIKHAIAPVRAGGQIHVSAATADGLLEIRVTDTGPGFELKHAPAGHGLNNLQARLSHLFGEQAKLAAVRHNGTTTTQVTIPRFIAHARISG